MILRQGVTCSTCNEIYILRISVGHSSYQEHSFACSNCGETITIGLDLDQKNAGWQFKIIENCILSDETLGTIINLHPEIVFSEELLHVDLISPSILYMSKMQEKLNQLPSDVSKEDYSDAKKNWEKIFLTHQEWGIIGKIWSLFAKNKDAQVKKFIIDNKDSIHDYRPNLTACEIIYSFIMRALAPIRANRAEEIIEKIFDEYENSDKELFNSFCKYHAREIFHKNMLRAHGIARDLFINYNEFNSVLWSLKKGESLPSNFAIASINFEKTKKIYGDAYECLGSNVLTLACISNIMKKRKFDTFENLTLAKYIEIDKSGKGKCFSDIPEFSDLMKYHIPKIRNGSHHGTFVFNHEHNQISYSPKANKSETISYSEYITCCVELFISCMTVSAIDIFIYDQLRFSAMKDTAGIV
ncbi:hypothetical protein [Desulfovibrio intestinalis]|uniref:Uncharacterized protein n=1 Tax=Desulfovibrio intestinalis TaxID=58621 RepID=A0A7W8C3J7_9BACT|nr:hypothetical protein [Desulfovibrio intestinalis]MBB5144676.1 hypothetical protein [Desulfovibrio intestinalis]